MPSLQSIKLNSPSPIIRTTQSNGDEAFMQVLPGPLIKVWGQSGPNDATDREWEGTFYIRPEYEIEDFVKKNAKSFKLPLPLEITGVRGWDEIVVPSNAICEDRHKIDIIPVDQLANLVRYGMGGSIFGDMISKTLHACLALTIARLKQDAPKGEPIDQERLEWALTDTFVAINQDFLNAPVSALRGLQERQDTSPIFPKLGSSNFLFGATEGSGCIACTVVVDTSTSKIHVAHVGDSRAVAGWYNHKEGKWRCDVLTEDQCGRNPKECHRRLARHPPEEADQVIYDRGWGNRVLGMNDVVRKFGGSCSVRSHAEENEIWNVFETKQAFNHFPKKTPPYTDTEAVVTYRDLKANPDEELKFIILATDDVWDTLTSEEAVLLTAAYKDNPSQGDIPKKALPERYPMILPTDPRPYPAQELPGTGGRAEGAWATMRVLSLRESVAREMRDDMTAV
ncbi:hypothetical protein V865_001276 [Kwoniella europaea PYCC6329]|uniref:PPM-type phosphatase domain-containing protein n=1 Tax=Kwoniella europaea PYCC6329 TaxID=1423913 RepID=A0AAX4KCA3_9TREE